MTNLIEHENNNSASVVKINGNTSEISLKTYQDVYHQITGRTERIRQRYSNNLLIDFPEIEQLHFKINQLCDIHNIVARNAIISVFHHKERKEEFTSFERFKAYNSNATKPSLNVVLKYNFSIIPAGMEKPQEYIITIKLRSRVAALQEIQDDVPLFMRGGLNFYIRNTAEISIEYADYIIARGFIESFDEWVNGCKSSPNHKWVNNLQKVSHFLPKTLQLSLTLFCIYFALSAIPFYSDPNSSPETLMRFITIFGGGLYIILILANIAGHLIEQAIDEIMQLSYLKLNRGDENLIAKFSSRKKYLILKFISGSAIAIVLGVISSKLSLFI